MTAAADAWHQACRAAAAFAVDPQGLGGIVLRAAAGPVRDAWLSLLADMLAPGTPLRRMPPGIDDSRLLGGLDLAATLRAGRPVLDRGLLASANGGVIVVPMAERLDAATAGKLAAVLDTGECLIERDGMTRRLAAAVGLVLLDESDGDDEAPPPALPERMAMRIDLGALSHRDTVMPGMDADSVARARQTLTQTAAPDTMQIEALCRAASALGVGSLRRPLLACRLARVLAALDGRAKVDDDDLKTAVQLALLPYARSLPAPPEAATQDPDPAPEADGRGRDTAPDQAGPSEHPAPPGAGDDIDVAIAATALPLEVLDALDLRTAERAAARHAQGGRRGPEAAGGRRGRPVGSRHGRPDAGHRLNLLATLRAAAPWQTLRRRHDKGAVPPGRLLVRPDDFRITRFRTHTENTTIFCVDASGSAALARLAEAKGAAELLLGRCYIRRDEVGVIVFKGTRAELLLPPTRSLTRARKCLTALPGGGGTPLATGIGAARTLADAERRRGRMPVVVLMTDGNANIDLGGAPGRDGALADAVAAARGFRQARLAGLLIDMSPRGSDKARRIAAAMGATYLFLPRKDPESVSRAAFDEVNALSGRAA